MDNSWERLVHFKSVVPTSAEAGSSQQPPPEQTRVRDILGLEFSFFVCVIGLCLGIG